MSKISKFLLFFFVSLCLACLIASQVNAATITTSDVQIKVNNSSYTAGQSKTGQGNLKIWTNAKFENSENMNPIYVTYPICSNTGNMYINLAVEGSVSGTRDYPIMEYLSSSSCNIDSSTQGHFYMVYFTIENMSASTTNYKNFTFTINMGSGKYVLLTPQFSAEHFFIIADNKVAEGTQQQTTQITNTISNQTSDIINNNNANTTSINNNLSDINNSLTSDNITGNNSSESITGITSSFQSSNDWLLNIFTLPYTFISSIMNGISNSCTPISLGTIFNYELVMPCMNLNSILGNVWTTIVDVICAGVFAFAFRRRIHDFIFAIITLDRKAIKIGGVDLL